MRLEQGTTKKASDSDADSTTSSQLRQQVEQAKQMIHESVTKQT